MRRSFDGLAQEVMDFLGEDPLIGYVARQDMWRAVHADRLPL
jgi:hypothetical protein